VNIIKLLKLIQEVSLDDYRNGDAIKLDSRGEWYIDKHGKYLRRAKFIFKTDELQSSICRTYRYIDPTKKHTDCIKVLLCITNKNDNIAITTLRKLDGKCINKHFETYSEVPKNIFKKAVKYTDKISDDDKKKILEMIRKLPHSNKYKDKSDKPRIVNSVDDLKK